jgi:lactate dehydrogenase-like 2-hydroxyacid dehydrogenase
MTTKPGLLVTRPPLLPEVDQRVNHEFSRRNADTPESLTPQGLLGLADGASALLITGADRLDADFFDHIPRSVKIVATQTVGVDHIDVQAAARNHVAVSNTPGIGTDAVADAAILLMLGASRRAYYVEQFLRGGQWRPPAARFLGRQLTGKVLGIYGMGRIGQATAQRARSLGMRIHYTDPTPLAHGVGDGAIFHQDPHDLLRVSEFLSLHAPATPENYHFLNAETLALLPPGAIIVNTARGDLIKDEDLLAALAEGAVAAVGLDVFEHEPNIDPRYFTLENAFLMPHIAAGTIETQTAVGMLALDNIDAVLGGRPAPSLVTA